MVSRCSHLTGRSSCLRRTETRNSKVRRTCSSPIGLSKHFSRNDATALRRDLRCAVAPLREKERMIVMKIKRLSLFIPCLLLARLAAFAQEAELEPSAAKVQQHVSYLASDALDGRRTGTPGANDAARYIAGEFERLGLNPGNGTRGDAHRRRGHA